ncbi:MAG: hypothetical protein Q9160_005491 [Pyrenula sp. 1 TL-2023]
MPRSITSAESSLTLDTPAGRVTLSFPAPGKRQNITVASLPEKSSFTPGLHWHESYVEYLQVLKGRARITIGSVTREFSAEDGPQQIAKFVPHEFMRADALKPELEMDEGPVEVMEWTEPDDGLKRVFFYNLMSILNDADGKVGLSSGIQLLTTAAYLDSFVVMAPGPAGFYVTHAINKAGSWLGWLMGYKPWYEEYTPKQLRAIAASGGEMNRKSR